MKILILNWRSINDGLAGGAELATLELSKRWVKNHKAHVIWLTTPPKKGLKKEIIEGVEFEYIGYPLKRESVLKMMFLFPYFYLLVIFKYFRRYKNNIDIIIDQSHGIPFLTPLYVREKVILYIHEYADIIWDKMYKFPINIIGKFLEKNFLRLYKEVITITGTKGTKNELLELELKEKNIKIINYGINIKPIKNPVTKFKEFTILFLNRVVKMKGPDQAIKIFSEVKKVIPEAKLIIAGRYENDYKKELEAEINSLNLKDIIFEGHISNERRLELLQKSNVLINTSIKEGWGIVNIEANSQGTPVVAFNVGGCKESVVEGVSGYLAKDNKEFVEKIIKIQTHNLSDSCIKYASRFSFDEKSEEFWRVINE